MVENQDLIDVIRDGRVRVDRLGFEPTRRCNFSCEQCYQGDPQQVELDPRVARTTLDYFSHAVQIDLYGGETMCSTSGVRALDIALGEAGTKFGAVSFVTNCSFINEKVMETLESMYDKADHSMGKGGVLVTVSNDYWHRKEEKRLGISRAEIWDNFLTMKRKHPRFIYKYRKYENKRSHPVVAVGRAASFGLPANQFVPKGEMLFYDEKDNDGCYTMQRFITNATGLEESTDFETLMRNKDTMLGKLREDGLLL